jgi:hypothetical protein
MGAVGRMHEIDYRRRAGLGLEFGFEDQRAGAIAPCRADRRILGGDKPTPIIGFPEQGGKARGRIKTWPAQPIDGAVATDKAAVLQSPISA